MIRHHHGPQHQALGRRDDKGVSVKARNANNNEMNKFKFEEADEDDEYDGRGQRASAGVRPVAIGNPPLHHGRPRIPSKQDVLDYTFGVPDSPQHRDVTLLAAMASSSFSLQSTSPSSSSVVSRTSSAESLTFAEVPTTTTSSTSKSSGNQASTKKAGDTGRKPTTLPGSNSRRPQPLLPGDFLHHEDSRAATVFETEHLHQVCEDSLRPWNYLLTIPGKNVRDMIIQAFHQWIPSCDATTQLVLIKQIIAYLHSASLIVDDIEDESLTRRGFPCAHIQFGLAPSLNAANYVYFLALEKALLLQSPEAISCFTNEMLNLHRGQGRDIFWRVSTHLASEPEYLHMVQDKTGGLFRLAIRLMLSVSKSSKERALEPRLLELCDDLASFFQIRDDLINLASPEFHKKKGFCEDITEGKLSFIALHSLRKLKASSSSANDERDFKELMELLQKKTTDRGEIKRAMAILKRTGSFDYTLKYLETLQAKIDDMISNRLGGNDKLRGVLSALAADLDDCRDIDRVLSS